MNANTKTLSKDQRAVRAFVRLSAIGTGVSWLFTVINVTPYSATTIQPSLRQLLRFDWTIVATDHAGAFHSLACIVILGVFWGQLRVGSSPAWYGRFGAYVRCMKMLFGAGLIISLLGALVVILPALELPQWKWGYLFESADGGPIGIAVFAILLAFARKLPEGVSANALDLPRQSSCVFCEYPLRGLTESRCPECGNEFPADWLEETR